MTQANQFRRLTLASIFVGVSLLAGCKVGPNYARPNVTAPPAFRGADDTAVSSAAAASLGDEQWTAVYREPELQQLITKALANNYDVRIAAQRILEQQAQVRITRSQEFPTLSIGGTGIGATLPSSLGKQIGSPLEEGSFSLSAAWTPDFWGLYRRQTEAARAQLLGQVWAQRAVRLTLVQQVATLYFQLRALDRQLEITQQTIKVRQDSLNLTKTLESGGSVPLSDVRQAEQLLYTATSQVPQLEEQIQQRRIPSVSSLAKTRAPSRTRTPTRSYRRRRIFPPVCLRSCLSAVLTFNRPKPLSSQPMHRSAWRARSSSPASPSALLAALAATVYPASSAPLERPFTASDLSRSRSSKGASSAGSFSYRKKRKRRWS